MEKTTYNINNSEVSEQEFLALKNELEIDKGSEVSSNFTTGPGEGGGSEVHYNAWHKETKEKYTYGEMTMIGGTAFQITRLADQSLDVRPSQKAYILSFAKLEFVDANTRKLIQSEGYDGGIQYDTVVVSLGSDNAYAILERSWPVLPNADISVTSSIYRWWKNTNIQGYFYNSKAVKLDDKILKQGEGAYILCTDDLCTGTVLLDGKEQDIYIPKENIAYISAEELKSLPGFADVVIEQEKGI